MAEPAVRIRARLPVAGDVRALESAERECFIDPWPGQYFMSELYAPGRYQRVLVDSAGDLAAYLFSAWQYLDLHVLKVATLPKYRRGGLARRLMAMAEAHANEMCGDSITLEVRADNRPALELYRAFGYTNVGLRRHYYADGSDAVIMTKSLLPLLRLVRDD